MNNLHSVLPSLRYMWNNSLFDQIHYRMAHFSSLKSIYGCCFRSSVRIKLSIRLLVKLAQIINSLHVCHLGINIHIFRPVSWFKNLPKNTLQNFSNICFTSEEILHQFAARWKKFTSWICFIAAVLCLLLSRSFSILSKPWLARKSSWHLTIPPVNHHVFQ